MSSYPMENQWDELARSSYRDDLDHVQQKLSVHVLQLKNKRKVTLKECIEIWMEENTRVIERWQSLVADIKSSTNVSLVTYSVILRELMDFAQSE
jgi:glutamate dehydrogenase